MTTVLVLSLRWLGVLMILCMIITLFKMLAGAGGQDNYADRHQQNEHKRNTNLGQRKIEARIDRERWDLWRASKGDPANRKSNVHALRVPNTATPKVDMLRVGEQEPPDKPSAA